MGPHQPRGPASQVHGNAMYERRALTSSILQNLRLTRCGKELCKLKLHVYEKREGYPFIFDAHPKFYNGVLFLGTAPLHERRDMKLDLGDKHYLAERQLITSFDPATPMITVFRNLDHPLYALAGNDFELKAKWNDQSLTTADVGNRWWRVVIGSVVEEICWCQRQMKLPPCKLGNANNCTLTLYMEDEKGKDQIVLRSTVGSDEFRKLLQSANAAEDRLEALEVETSVEE